MQLREALRLISAEGCGIVVYNRDHEGRGIGLLAKLAAYGLQDEGLDTVEANVTLGHPADGRDYGVAARILHDLGVESVRLLTNNPDKIRQLEARGIGVSGRVPHEVGLTRHNDAYLATKAEKLGHLITGNGTDVAD
jgi:3,4-dihydroxy 2-butanone 4-phosphate synthase/GTP cyclohydrolase II